MVHTVPDKYDPVTNMWRICIRAYEDDVWNGVYVYMTGRFLYVHDDGYKYVKELQEKNDDNEI